ncbi:MAG: imidazole glycerol phosphate synthase subunit HisH [Alphaproteobacteria bacterium]
MSRIGLIEYGIGNVRSVQNALGRIGAEADILCDGDSLLARDPACIVMPGVGAVGEALSLLRQRGLDSALQEVVLRRGVPFLGICVGMQVLAEICEEFGEHRGLGWIPGRVRRLAQDGSGLRVPHVGWNTITLNRDGDFAAGLDDEHFYFVHSFFVDCPDEYIVATCPYGSRFAAAIRRGPIMGVQFHPEKSSAAGEALLRGFLAQAAMAA